MKKSLFFLSLVLVVHSGDLFAQTRSAPEPGSAQVGPPPPPPAPAPAAAGWGSAPATAVPALVGTSSAVQGQGQQTDLQTAPQAAAPQNTQFPHPLPNNATTMMVPNSGALTPEMQQRQREQQLLIEQNRRIDPNQQQQLQPPLPMNMNPPAPNQPIAQPLPPPLEEPIEEEYISPDFQQFAPGSDVFVYDPTGKRDPFEKDAGKKTQVGQTADVPAAPTRPMDPLEQYDTHQLRVAAIITDSKNPRAMIADPRGGVHFVKLRSRIGQKNGFIVAIREGEVVVVEYVDQDGKWVKSFTTLQLR